ncbi:hypothetical protein H0H93_015352 [Arthromyces matolae]|nr:hypothetical protein H0H93_015352 [Arthromyces matolae]
MRGLVTACLLSALLATATPIGRINSLIVRDVHEPDVAKLIPRAPPSGNERPSPPPEIQEIPRLPAENDLAYAQRRLSLIFSQSGVGQEEQHAAVRPKVVKWINDLARDTGGKLNVM